MSSDLIADVAVIIVGFRNPADLRDCLTALSRATAQPNFDVFICENGGVQFYHQLIDELLGARGLCRPASGGERLPLTSSHEFVDVRQLRFEARESNIWLGCARDNLGYAGGINAWLRQLDPLLGWRGVWILNPDTEPHPGALAAMVERAGRGAKGMVGSTITDPERSDEVRCRGGLRWDRFAARTIAIGIGESVNAPFDLLAIEAEMDSPSGASMYVTRVCLKKIGLMNEMYFLFFEDLDWGVRAKACGLGYASESIVRHKRGTTTGSGRSLALIPQLSVYLEQRNGIHFVRAHFPWMLSLRIGVSAMYAARFLKSGFFGNFVTALRGLSAGLKGEVGRPRRYL